MLCRWLLVAVATMLLLLQLTVADDVTNQDEDKPSINYSALFTAYIRLGDALFGTWTPEDFESKLQRIRAEED
ncbi:hypothetical protein ACLKA7_014491 [Drosophila subpalustris]